MQRRGKQRERARGPRVVRVCTEQQLKWDQRNHAKTNHARPNDMPTRRAQLRRDSSSNMCFGVHSSNTPAAAVFRVSVLNVGDVVAEEIGMHRIPTTRNVRPARGTSIQHTKSTCCTPPKLTPKPQQQAPSHLPLGGRLSLPLAWAKQPPNSPPPEGLYIAPPPSRCPPAEISEIGSRSLSVRSLQRLAGELCISPAGATPPHVPPGTM